MLPPPAPIVWMSIVGIDTGSVSNCCSVSIFAWPPAMSDASRLVPPMSIVIRFSCPRISPSAAAPMTPPAGPDSTRCTGCSFADATVIAPPPERVSRKCPPNLPCSRLPSSVSRYVVVIGLTYASITAVLVRSYSRYSRLSRCESVTETSGHSSRSTSSIASSCAGFA